MAWKLNEKDYEKKKFKAAPAGTYSVRILNDSKLKRMSNGKGVEIKATITKGPHKKTNFFDNVSVSWKVAQLVEALSGKKKKITISPEELLKMVKGKDLRAQLRVEKYEGKDRNKVAQWLPLNPTAEEAEEDLDALDDEDEDDDADADESDDDSDEDDEDESSDDDEDEDEDDDDSDSDSDEDDDDGDDEDDSDDDDDDDDADSDVDEDDEDDDDADDADEVEEEKPKGKRAAKPVAKPAPKPAAKKAAAKKAPAKGRKR